MTTRAIVRITDETTRADLAETLNIVNGEAMAISRRGYAGTRSAEYDVKHDRINALLGDYLRAPA